MTATTYPTRAHRLLAEMVERDDVRPALRVVSEVSHEGERWVIATNGRVLIAEKSDDAPAEDLRGVNEEDLRSTPAPERFAAIAFPTPYETVIGECCTSQLRDFCGTPDPAPAPAPCKDCGGTGSMEHDCDCEFCEVETEECWKCEGSGSITLQAPIRYGWIGGGLFNRDLVGRAAALLAEAGPYTLSITAWDIGHRLRIARCDHFAVIMSCLDTGDDNQRDAPHFEVAA